MHAPENVEAIRSCLEAACRGLSLDIAEIWRRESRTQARYSCLHVFASPATITMYSSQLAGVPSDTAKRHKLSPLVSRTAGGLDTLCDAEYSWGFCRCRIVSTCHMAPFSGH
jgi:hypothetical protein